MIDIQSDAPLRMREIINTRNADTKERLLFLCTPQTTHLELVGKLQQRKFGFWVTVYRIQTATALDRPPHQIREIQLTIAEELTKTS